MNQKVLSAKQELVSEITNKIKDSDSTVIVEYRGLTVTEITELRRNLRAENVEMKVYKNTMVQRAVDELGFNELDADLTGPNAFAFSKDATAPARVLAKFAKKHKALVLKSGIVEGKAVNNEVIAELSALPNRDGMLSMLLGCLQSPVSKFARAVKAVADKKGEAPAEVAAEEVKAEEAVAA